MRNKENLFSYRPLNCFKVFDVCIIPAGMHYPDAINFKKYRKVGKPTQVIIPFFFISLELLDGFKVL